MADSAPTISAESAIEITLSAQNLSLLEKTDLETGVSEKDGSTNYRWGVYFFRAESAPDIYKMRSGESAPELFEGKAVEQTWLFTYEVTSQYYTEGTYAYTWENYE